MYWEDRAAWLCGWFDDWPVWGPKRGREAVTMEQAHQLADATGGAFRFYPVERITIDWPDEPKRPEPEPLSPEVAEAVESFWRSLAERDAQQGCDSNP